MFSRAARRSRELDLDVGGSFPNLKRTPRPRPATVGSRPPRNPDGTAFVDIVGGNLRVPSRSDAYLESVLAYAQPARHGLNLMLVSPSRHARCVGVPRWSFLTRSESRLNVHEVNSLSESGRTRTCVPGFCRSSSFSFRTDEDRRGPVRNPSSTTLSIAPTRRSAP